MQLFKICFGFSWCNIQSFRSSSISLRPIAEIDNRFSLSIFSSYYSIHCSLSTSLIINYNYYNYQRMYSGDWKQSRTAWVGVHESLSYLRFRQPSTFFWEQRSIFRGWYITKHYFLHIVDIGKIYVFIYRFDISPEL